MHCLSHLRTASFGAWLLCLLLAVGSVCSANCIFCNDGGPVHSNALHLLNTASQHAPDGCNGACSCCGFHWVPAIQQPVIAFAPAPLLPAPLIVQQLHGWSLRLYFLHEPDPQELKTHLCVRL
jgi:hypothetical protein